MIRQHATTLRAILILADAALAIVILYALAALRFGPGPTLRLDPALSSPELILPVYAAGWVATLASQGLYRIRARWRLRNLVLDLLRATAIFAVGTAAFLFVFKLGDLSRLLLILLFPTLAAGALVLRLANRAVLQYMRMRGSVRNMLVVGAGAPARSFADLVESHRELGMVVIGHLGGGPDDDGVAPRRPILGTLDQVEEILHGRIVDEVAICLPVAEWATVDQLARLCEEEGKIVRIPLQMLERPLVAGRIEEIDGLPIYSVVSGPDRAVGLFAKRVLDVAGSAALLVILSPLAAVIAFVIRRDSAGPVIYRQTRVGMHGRTFQVLKFRTMDPDAERQLDELREHNTIDGHAFKMDDDPRVTRAGRWLRRTSLDELPQLWNVLRGEMSLVGPRPPLPAEVAGYDIWHRRRLSMKPGMTGLWQIRARRERDFDRWVEADLEYIDQWSFWLDLNIIARTVPAMLSGQGR